MPILIFRLKSRLRLAVGILPLLCVAAQAQDEDYNIVPGTFEGGIPRIEQSIKKKAESPLADQRQILVDAPVSDDAYVIAPGDVLRVTLGRDPEFDVGPDGSVAFPGFAPIKVSGLTLSEARARIHRLTARAFDTTKVFVSISEPGRFRVWISGEVNHPGAKPANAYMRLTDLVEAADGFTPYAAPRHVRVFRGDSSVTTVDLSAYFRDLDPRNNPPVHFGDRVVVDRIDFTKPYCVVRQDGRSYYVGLDEKSAVSDIHRRVSGFSDSSPLTRAIVTPAGGKPIELTPDRFSTYMPASGDTVFFSGKKEMIFVGGAVMKSGSFEYVPGLTPRDYAFLAGMSIESAADVTIRVSRGSNTYSQRSFGDKPVLPGDRIFVERRSLIVARDYVVVLSSVAGIVISATTLYIATQQ
jgi:polysaccharide export outer membrane protein